MPLDGRVFGREALARSRLSPFGKTPDFQGPSAAFHRRI